MGGLLGQTWGISFRLNSRNRTVCRSSSAGWQDNPIWDRVLLLGIGGHASAAQVC